MKKNTARLLIAFLFLLSISFSGCEVIFPPTIYETGVMKIGYALSYGYHMTITGKGSYEIMYLCDIPEVLIGTVSYNLLYTQEYETKTLLNNSYIYWNISGNDETTFEIGLRASVEATSYLVRDLNGDNAASLLELKGIYATVVNQYTKIQGNDTIRFIDPSDSDIAFIATTIQENEKTNNSFLIAKALFSWLKQNIQYQTHPNEKMVRSAAVTLQSKQGDCDDLSFLYISLCRAVEIPARFIRGYLISKDITTGAISAVAHAWVEVFVGTTDSHNGWIPVECACCVTSVETDIQQNFGVETAYHLRLYTDDGSNESLKSSLSGISYVIHQPNTHIQLEPFAEIQNYEELKSKQLIITDKNIRYFN
jgi:hypothetical protein